MTFYFSRHEMPLLVFTRHVSRVTRYVDRLLFFRVTRYASRSLILFFGGTYDLHSR